MKKLFMVQYEYDSERIVEVDFYFADDINDVIYATRHFRAHGSWTETIAQSNAKFHNKDYWGDENAIKDIFISQQDYKEL